jgi:nicotinate phosphoribosyltransferase
MEFLDNDFYNFTMSYYAWEYHKQDVVNYRFTNRSRHLPVKGNVERQLLADKLDEVTFTKPTMEEIKSLRELNLFNEDYLRDLENISLPFIYLDEVENEYYIEYAGPWWSAMFLETPILAAISELLYGGYDLYPARLRLAEKINLLKSFPYLNVSEFGTRRRASAAWQEEVLVKLIDYRPYQVIGTSNVKLALKFGIKPIGTMAHQLFMVTQATTPQIQSSVLEKWVPMFKTVPKILLTDTYGTDFCLNSLNRVQTNWFDGFRQDSGDPVEIGNKIISKLKSCEIDPRTKSITFSDGLTIQKMADIWGQFSNQINVNFGWGTNFTNDLAIDIAPRSMVIKPIMVNDSPCVKLSDNIEKATGAQSAIDECKKLVGYNTTYSQKATY